METMESTSFRNKLLILDINFWYIILGLSLFYYTWSRRKMYVVSWQIPGPFAPPFIGHTLYLLMFGVSNIFPLLKILMRQFKHNNKLLRVWYAGELVVLVSDADIATQINTATLLKADVQEHLGPPLMKKGIFADTNIPHWKASRKVITQVFTFKILKSYIKIFHEEAVILKDKLRKFSDSGENLYVPKVMELCTYNAIMRTSMGYNPNAQFSEEQPFIDEIHNMFQHFQRKIFLPFLRNSFIYSLLGMHKEEQKTMKILMDIAENVLIDRSKGSRDTSTDIDRKSLAELLLEHPEISMEEAKAQIVTIVGAGLDTSMVQNSLVLTILAVRPDVQKKLYEELIEVLGDDETVCPSYEDLMKLEYLDRVLKETLRLFPAAPTTARKITEEVKFTLDGKEYTIPPGICVCLLIYYIQRRPEYFDNPHEFDADRWLPENVAKRNVYSFIPFGSGPRNCIGGKYAMLQMKTLISTIIRRYEVLPSESCKVLRDIKVRMNLTMEIKHNCQIKLKERNKLV